MASLEESNSNLQTYPVRVAASMTGLKPELIRAWETRYNAVQPDRTEGGSRRYSDEDLSRLRLLRDVVDAGHRIGSIAQLSLEDLRSLLPDSSGAESDPLERIIRLAEKLDGAEVRRLLGDELSRLGPVAFATDIALPLLVEIGSRWEHGSLGISVEHLTTAILRSMLLSDFDAVGRTPGSPRAIFATPSGEPHDLGTLVAALVALRAGAEVAFLGADVPVDDLVDGIRNARASVLVLGIVTLPPEEADSILREVRKRVPDDVGVWIGGAGIRGLAPHPGVERISNLDQLEAQITLLNLRVSGE
jgi:DNA-binding transcriptional MerR regulator/methylmalonyl-CoA mutase cobalamin-binding subunit